MLSQKGFQEKVDGSTKSDYNIFDLAQRNLENSDEDKIIKNYINDLYDQTSLLQEVQNILSCCKQIKDKYESTYIEEFQNIEPISVLVFKNESDINQDEIKIEISVKNICVDVHPVVHFDKYLSIYGEELSKNKQKNENYPTYNSKAEFRTS